MLLTEKVFVVKRRKLESSALTDKTSKRKADAKMVWFITVKTYEIIIHRMSKGKVC